MSLSIAEKKQFRAIAHHLNPVVIISENGVGEGVVAELERALSDHELIKIKLASNDREVRQEMIRQVCELSRSEHVQTIGKMAILYRKATRPDPRLSNILRFQSGKLAARTGRPATPSARPSR